MIQQGKNRSDCQIYTKQSTCHFQQGNFPPTETREGKIACTGGSTKAPHALILTDPNPGASIPGTVTECVNKISVGE